MCRKPTGQQITARMLHICRQEGLQVNESALGALAEGTNGDIRLVLGQLQMVRLRANHLSFDEAKVLVLLLRSEPTSPRLPLPVSVLSNRPHSCALLPSL